MSVVIWVAVVLLVAILSFLAGVSFGRGFWLDVTWLKTRR